MTAALFLAGALLLAVVVIVAARRHLPPAAARWVTVGLPLWLLCVGVVSRSGMLADPARRPPGVLFVVVPVILFIALFAVRSAAGARVAARLPLSLLMGAQVFRVGVELGLYRLGAEGLVPRLMTFEGGNIDILVGLTAPIAAWLATRGDSSRGPALAWNAIGLLALVNVVARSVLTAPGPLNLIHADVPNLAIGTFPYTYIAGFFAPLAVLLHVLSIRRLRALQPRPPAASEAVA